LGSVWLPAPALVEAEDRFIYFAPASLSLFFLFIFTQSPSPMSVKQYFLTFSTGHGQKEALLCKFP